MPSPFPGFDPYLEDRLSWSSVHAPLIVFIQTALRARLPPGFVAKVEQHLAVEVPGDRFPPTKNTSATRQPDVTVFETERGGNAVTEKFVVPIMRPVSEPEVVMQEELMQRFVQIYDRRGGRREVVAVIELLSPINKDGGNGAAQYRRKQREIIEAGIHLLEIDLLRYGSHAVYVPKTVLDDSGGYDYVLTLADADHPTDLRFWRIGLRDPLPVIALPLTPDVAPVLIDLQATFTNCYDASGLGDDVDYRREPEPPLSSDDAAWTNDLLRAAGLR